MGVARHAAGRGAVTVIHRGAATVIRRCAVAVTVRPSEYSYSGASTRRCGVAEGGLRRGWLLALGSAWGMSRGAAVALLIALGVLSGCGQVPTSREQVESPDRLRIPPRVVAEPKTDGKVAADSASRPGSSQAEKAGEELSAAPQAGESTIPSRVRTDGDQVELLIDMRLNRAWINTGSVLDRLNFTILERQRDKLRYTIRYSPRADEDIEQPGFFARVFGGAERIDTSPRRFFVELEQRTTAVAITLKDEQGNPARAEIAQQLLTLLDRQLY